VETGRDRSWARRALFPLRLALRGGLRGVVEARLGVGEAAGEVRRRDDGALEPPVLLEARAERLARERELARGAVAVARGRGAVVVVVVVVEGVGPLRRRERPVPALVLALELADELVLPARVALQEAVDGRQLARVVLEVELDDPLAQRRLVDVADPRRALALDERVAGAQDHRRERRGRLCGTFIIDLVHATVLSGQRL